MNTKKKAIAGIIIATIALASVAIAVSAQGEGVGPMAIVPGSITNTHLASNAVSANVIATGGISDSADFAAGVVDSAALGGNAVIAGKIATGAISEEADFGSGVVNSTAIKQCTILEEDMMTNQVNDSILKAGAIPLTRYNRTTTLSTLNASFESDLAYDSWNVTTVSLNRDAYLVIHWTGIDCWTDDSTEANYTKMRIAVDGVALAAPFDSISRITDTSLCNRTASVTAYTDSTVGTGSHTITIQIAKAAGDEIVEPTGINKQVMVVEAIPA